MTGYIVDFVWIIMLLIACIISFRISILLNINSTLRMCVHFIHLEMILILKNVLLEYLIIFIIILRVNVLLKHNNFLAKMFKMLA